MSSQEEDRKSESGKESGGGFGWVSLGLATVIGGFIGALLSFLSTRPGSTEGPHCNVSAGRSTSADTGNETFRNRPLTCEPCGICLDDIQLVVTLPCGHRFHANCVEKWIRDNSTCPSCRMNISPDQMKYSV